MRSLSLLCQHVRGVTHMLDGMTEAATTYHVREVFRTPSGMRQLREVLCKLAVCHAMGRTLAVIRRWHGGWVLEEVCEASRAQPDTCTPTYQEGTQTTRMCAARCRANSCAAPGVDLLARGTCSPIRRWSAAGQDSKSAPRNYGRLTGKKEKLPKELLTI